MGGTDPADLQGRQLERIACVRDPTDLFYTDTVAQECADADAVAGFPLVRPGTA